MLDYSFSYHLLTFQIFDLNIKLLFKYTYLLILQVKIDLETYLFSILTS